MKRLAYILFIVLGVSACSKSTVTGSSATQSSPSKVVLASGMLQRCVGIIPNSGKIIHGGQNPQYCDQLPAADPFNQAGVKFLAGDHAGAAQILTKAAQAGNAIAQLRLAIMYDKGDGVPRDRKSAFMWYSRAAAQGEPASQMELGGFYETADGVPENWDLAAALYKASAMQGWLKGQFMLARAYQFGIGVPQNRQLAIEWYRKAAAQGEPNSDYWVRWLSDPTNNIGFRTDEEHDAVIKGNLRFALGAGDPAGITFHSSAQRNDWLAGLGHQVDASEAQAMWQMRKNDYDSCTKSGGGGCIPPGPQPGH
jgi:TPR repeat protein